MSCPLSISLIHQLVRFVSLYSTHVSIPYVLTYWNMFVHNLCWRKVWLFPHKYLLVNKIKEVSYKIIHRFHPASHYLKKYKKDIDSNCGFCGEHPESVSHLFWYCSSVKTFWQDTCRFVVDHILADFVLLWENVLFGFHTYDKNKDFYCYIVNFVLLMAKYHIH